MTDTAAHETTGHIPFPQQRTCPYKVPEGYSKLVDQGDLCKVTLYDGNTAWVVTRHAVARKLLSDPRLSSNLTRPGFPILSPRMESIRDSHPVFIEMDPPDHTYYRKMLNADFSVRRMHELRPQIERIVESSIDKLLGMEPPVDLVEEFAVPLPLTVICSILGIPTDDPEQFKHIQNAGQALVKATTAEEAHAAGGTIFGLLNELCTEQEKNPGDGLIGHLAAEQVATGALDHMGFVQIIMLLLIAGYETTANMITLGVITLLDHPDQLARLSEPGAGAGTSEELLRYLAIADVAALRVATEDIEIAGRRIRAGEGVIMASSMANRDPSAFPDPERLDVTRSARHHLSFGYGVHQCLGQNLARLELEIVLPRLFARIPSLRLAVPVDSLTLYGPGTTQGVEELPVIWD